MFTPSHTPLQSLTNCSKKVADMILYVVSKKMAKQLLSTTSDANHNHSLEISLQKNASAKCNRKMSIL